MSLVVHACCGKETSNLVGCASGTAEMSPTLRQTASSRRKSGEIRKPTIGMPSRTAATAPATCVPSRSNCRRLSRLGSRCAITNEPVEAARRPQDDEEQGHGDGQGHLAAAAQILGEACARPGAEPVRQAEQYGNRERDIP